MGPIDHSEPEKLRARQAFARRLKVLRVSRGFITARSLAKALDIDENRYTRYERAEVEPDIALLCQICIALDITPNDLFGFADAPGAMAAPDLASLPAAGFAEVNAVSSSVEARGAAVPLDQVQSAAWSLAKAVAGLRVARETAAGDASATIEPLAVLRATVALHRELISQPFEAIGRIVGDAAIAAAEPAQGRQIHNLVQQLTDAIARATGRS